MMDDGELRVNEGGRLPFGAGLSVNRARKACLGLAAAIHIAKKGAAAPSPLQALRSASLTAPLREFPPPLRGSSRDKIPSTPGLSAPTPAVRHVAEGNAAFGIVTYFTAPL